MLPLESAPSPLPVRSQSAPSGVRPGWEPHNPTGNPTTLTVPGLFLDIFFKSGIVSKNKPARFPHTL